MRPEPTAEVDGSPTRFESAVSGPSIVMVANSARKKLRASLDRGDVIVAPGAYDGLGARVVEALGFPAVYVGGFASAAHLGIQEPQLTLGQSVEVARTVAAAAEIPVICDGGAGYGDHRAIRRCVEMFEDAGVAAIHLEDEIYPKPAVYQPGEEEILPLDVFLSNIECALQARRDPDFLIIGRTDAFDARGGGHDELVRRALALKRAGVDAIVGKGVALRGDLSSFRRSVPDIPMLTWAGKHDISVQEYAELGYQIIAFALAPITTTAEALWDNYQALLDTGRLAVTPERLLLQRQLVFRLVGLAE